MQSVTVNVDELREALEVNRAGHRQAFEAAQEVYRQRVVEWLGQRLDDARHGRRLVRSIELPIPVDYTYAYDRVLRMLDMSVDGTVELSARDFERYVMDRWEWRDDFVANTTSYLAIEGDA